MDVDSDAMPKEKNLKRHTSGKTAGKSDPTTEREKTGSKSSVRINLCHSQHHATTERPQQTTGHPASTPAFHQKTENYLPN